MKTRALALYWLLLLAPAVLLGGWAFRLLGHERERMERQARAVAGLHADTAAASLRSSVAQAENHLTGILLALPPGEEAGRLADLRSTRPLVRNAFVWTPAAGLVYPAVGKRTTEEQRFATRYEALFAGRDAWQAQPADDTAAGPAARGPTAAPRETAADGWRPWFEEDRLYLLGWVRRDDGSVCGIELDWPVLLSQIVSAFPDPGEGWTYTLLDGAGRVMHQRGPAPLDIARHPDFLVSLAPELPHWQLGAVAWGGANAGSGAAFVLVGALLIGVFLMSMLSGGALLTWQALAQQRDARRKTNFVSNVSHEFKTPLTTIRMYAELLSEDRVKDEGKRRRYLDVIVQETRRLTRLVNNVLDFSRLEQGRKTCRPEDIAIGDFLNGFIDAHATRLAEEGLQVRTAIEHGETRVRFDRDALEQILLNLVDNAIKYAAEGRELTLAGAPTGAATYTLRVADRGPGVPREHRERIFEKFYRIDCSLTASRPGSGLGLSIARGLARELGGDVRFEPRDGGGSCFMVALTRADRPGDGAAAPEDTTA